MAERTFIIDSQVILSNAFAMSILSMMLFLFLAAKEWAISCTKTTMSEMDRPEMKAFFLPNGSREASLRARILERIR